MAGSGSPCGVDLYWLPLGAGGRVVRRVGRAYEAISARAEGRERRDLFHAALEAHAATGRYVIEQAPAWGIQGERGVVAEGPVGSRLLGRWRLFRYEVRCWRDGVIPDLAEAVGSPVRVSDDPAAAQRLLDLVPTAPTPTWGRDELGAGEMWNSNSLVAWLLVRSGLDIASAGPPSGGRAPGWRAGVAVGQRHCR